MTAGLERAIAFWKPRLTAEAMGELVTVRGPDEGAVPGINVVRCSDRAAMYRVEGVEEPFRLFARVQPMPALPAGTEAVATLIDSSGSAHSYVAWDPSTRSLTVPFDPDEAVDAFRHEDWVPVGKRTALPKPLLALYYTVAKPLMPRALKQRLRRAMARRALSSPDSLSWPTDDSQDALQRFLLKLIMLASDTREVAFAWFWPEGHPWAVTLTHDVETAAGFARIGHVAELERERGLRSSFNLVACDYDSPEDILRELGADGFEFGVHGSTHDGLLFSDWELFLQRCEVINAFGERIGAAGFRSPATYRDREWMQRLAFDYDSSYSNTAPCEPQPGGCASFFPYALGDLVELPITLPQDHTLFELLEQKGAGTWLAALDATRSGNGMACVLAHPDPAPGYIGMPDNEAAYLELLGAVRASDAWCALPREVAAWWRRRSALEADAVASLHESALGRAFLEPSGRLRIVAPTAVR